MVILGLISYILVGISVAIGYGVSKYKNYKNNDSRDWDTYYDEQNLREWFVMIILCWPILAISMIPYLLAQIPKIIIKKYLDD